MVLVEVFEADGDDEGGDDDGMVGQEGSSCQDQERKQE